MLSIQGISYRIAGRSLLDNVSLNIPAGRRRGRGAAWGDRNDGVRGRIDVMGAPVPQLERLDGRDERGEMGERGGTGAYG